MLFDLIQDVMILFVGDNTNKGKKKDSFIMFIYSTDQVEFYCTAQPDAKYIGYFEYEKHMVEVCSHASLAYFFSKEEEKKQFDSISVLPHGFKGLLPDKIHMTAGFLYLKGKFKLLFARSARSEVY